MLRLDIDAERIPAVIDLELRIDRLDRAPVAIPHREIQPPHDLDIADLHIAQIGVLQLNRQWPGPQHPPFR